MTRKETRRPSAADKTRHLLEIHLFGRFDVQAGGVPLPRLRSRKGQWLLALLALNAGRNVERSWLAGTLWPDASESHALANLRQSLNDLRRALGAAAPLVGSPTPRSLRLDTAGAYVDVLAFDAAVRAGDTGSLARAAALYAGPLLEGCDEPWAVQERSAREQAYLAALEALASAALAQKEHAAAIQHLRLAVAVDPFRESAHRALMQALAAAGNAPAALLVYRDLRLFLRREIGADPDEETRRIYQQLRLQTRERADAGPLAAPVSAIPPSSPRSLRFLPRPLTQLIGREDAVRDTLGALAEVRLVTLTGTGGVGKTRLAIHLAEEIAEDFTDGVFFVDLAPVGDPALTPRAVAGALGIPESPGAPVTDSLRQYLRSRSLLLLLDNCEHLLDACATLAGDLLTACPGLRILVTSRQPLGLTGEVVRRVPSLPVPPAGGEPPEVLREYPAVRLFDERARAALSSFAVTDRSAPFVAQVCRRLDGIPLAIELAAARVRALSPEQIAARLDDRFGLLTGGSRAALPRQQTLRATLDWSYDLLTEREQALLRRLSVFAGGWTLEAAEKVCAGGGIDEWDVLDLLTALLDKSLVVYEEPVGKARYRLLETVRQYARDKAASDANAEVYRRLHRAYFLARAEEAMPNLSGPEQACWLDVLETEHGNLRQALTFCLEQPEEAETGLRLGGALGRFWWTRGHLSEGREHLTALLSLPLAQERTKARALALHAAGSLAQRHGDYASALSLHEESLMIRRELGDKGGIASSLNSLGTVAWSQGDVAAARSLYEESLAIQSEVGDRLGIAISLNNLGIVAFRQGNRDAARSLYEESLAIQRELGDKVSIAIGLHNLGNVARDQGDYAAACVLEEECLTIRTQLGDTRGMAWCLGDLGHLARYQGDYDAARSLYEKSLAIQRAVGEKLGIAECLHNLGTVARRQGDHAAARSLDAESLTIHEELGNRLGIAAALEAIAALNARENKMEPAARLWGAAERLREEIGSPLPPAEREEYDCAVSAARQARGDEAFLAAWEQGRALTLEQAVKYALEEVAEAPSERDS